MSRSFLRRVTPLIRFHIEKNHRLLTSVAEEFAPDTDAAVYMTDNCVRRMKELKFKEESSEGKMLRLSVETGGCSGFQYAFLLDEKKHEDDRIFEKDGVKLVVDNISYDFVKGATIDYVEELIRSAFQAPFGTTVVVMKAVVKPSFMNGHLRNFIRFYVQVDEVLLVGVHE